MAKVYKESQGHGLIHCRIGSIIPTIGHRSTLQANAATSTLGTGVQDHDIIKTKTTKTITTDERSVNSLEDWRVGMTIDDAKTHAEIQILDSRAWFYVRAGVFVLSHQVGQDSK